MRFTRKTTLLAAGAALVLSLGSVAVAADGPDNPQLKSNNARAAAAAAVPASCLKMAQPASGTYANVRNAPSTYNLTANSGAWVTPGCGTFTFTVPRGQQALVDLTATAELDCNSTSPNGWCEGRILVGGTPAKPDNTGRGDTYAFDSTNGGSLNWSAHSLNQVAVVKCLRVVNVTTPCSYKAELQVRGQNGAQSLWFDDLTFKAKVTQGTVTTTSAPVTP